jgi:hypothetical protein
MDAAGREPSCHAADARGRNLVRRRAGLYSMISAQTRFAFVRLKGKPVFTHRVKPEGMFFRIML